jgi:hypothetical protein
MLKGRLRIYFLPHINEVLDQTFLLCVSCWMRTRFPLYEQVWLQKKIKNIDTAVTIDDLLGRIEDIYDERLRGRLGLEDVLFYEMVEELPPCLKRYLGHDVGVVYIYGKYQ